MKKAYKVFWILLILIIPIFPLSGILYGVDISDVGLSINQYRFGLEDISSVYLPILLSEMMGAVWLKICGILAVPSYLGVEIAWILAVYYMCFISYRIYRRYRNDALVLPALALAELFAKCNFHYFIYATGVAVMALTALYFLILALNEKKPLFLSLAVFFLVMATLCKVSSIVQFAVFAVLFYDLYQKRDWKYFWKQILYCVLGLVAGILAALALIQATCGLQAYGEMLVEMFLYAGNSQDGHTLGNMLLSNVKGALRGVALLAALYVVYLIPKKLPGVRKIFRYGVPVLILLFLIGGIAGLGKMPGFSVLYTVIFDYLNALGVVVALIYICTVLIVTDKAYSTEFKNLALCAGVLTLLMPIGSNTGIQHVCNEIFFVLPFIVIYLGDRLRGSEYFSELPHRNETGGAGSWKRMIPTTGVTLALITLIWCVGLAGYQSLYLTRAYHTASKTTQIKQFELPELLLMSYEQDMVDELEDITGFLKQYEGGERKLLVAGAAPILNYLSGIAPFNGGCGGWIETEFITYEKIKNQLENPEINPIVVFCRTALAEDNPKIQLVVDFVDANAYEQVYETDEYIVYVPVE